MSLLHGFQRIRAGLLTMDDDSEEVARPPRMSRLTRPGNRRYRVLTRSTTRHHHGYPRLRSQLAVEQLLGKLIAHHGLTEEVRQQAVCLYWPEIAGDRIASKTFPVSFAEGVLQVSTISSSWLHELQFSKTQLIARIHSWVEANQVWLGPPPLVTDLRFALAMRQRRPLVDREYALRLRDSRKPRMRVEALPPIATDADREAIREATSAIDDPELRERIEAIRMKWNR